MTTAKEQAIQWVHRYAIGSAAVAALPLPLASAGLMAINARMVGTIEEVYGEKAGGPVMGIAVKAGLALVGRMVRKTSERATAAVPSMAKPLVRMAIAGVTTEALGLGLVLYYERQKSLVTT